MTDEKPHASHGPIRRAAEQFLRDRVALAALLWVGVVGAIAVLSWFWTPNDPNLQFTSGPFEGPSWNNLLGTDDLGRDVASRLMVGAWVSLRVSFVVVAAALAISIPIGLFAGYSGGWADAIIMRLLDAVTSVPGIVAALAIVGVLGAGLNNVMIALVVVLVPGLVRLVRAQALAVSAEPFVTASRSVGSSTPWILFMRIFPGVIPALSVQVSLSLGAALTSEAALSFLGLGVQAPDASWGGVLDRSYRNILQDPEGMIAPMVAIGSVVLAFNLIGDGLRDALGKGVDRGSRRGTRLGLTSAAADRSRDAGGGAGRRGAGDAAPRLDVEGLTVEFATPKGRLRAVDDVRLRVAPGEILGVVGESGSGKTVTAMAIMRLLPSPPAIVSAGRVGFDHDDLLDLSLAELRDLRGGEVAMVFQNPMTSLDPVFTIGHAMREAIRNHSTLDRKAADARAVELLELVGIPTPAERLRDYPHQFSGGMRQRVMIAMALAGDPKLLIADEPTTALDVTIQAQILELLDRLRTELGLSIVLVTHDLGVVAETCDRVAVMYAGQIVEEATVDELFSSPRHPYTSGLIAAAPSIDAPKGLLPSLPGIVPRLEDMPSGCRFAARCEHATAACTDTATIELGVVDGRSVRCLRAAELELSVR